MRSRRNENSEKKIKLRDFMKDSDKLWAALADDEKEPFITQYKASEPLLSHL